jgi:hypothetical protein
MDLTAAERQDIEQVLERWLLRCRTALKAYNQAATRAVAAERRLGIPAVGLSALVATGLFASLESDPDLGWRIAAGIVAAVAATLTALQTFLRQGERAEQFHEAARGYGRLRRKIEQTQLFLPLTRSEAVDVLASIAGELNETSIGKPNVPRSIWEWAEYLVKGTSDARGHRALMLCLKERLQFGVGQGRGPLPEDHERYFDLLGAKIVPIEAVNRPSTVDTDSKVRIEAKRKLHRSARGTGSRRPPLTVIEKDAGSYELLEGAPTLLVAIEEGWRTVPIKEAFETATGSGGPS